MAPNRHPFIIAATVSLCLVGCDAVRPTLDTLKRYPDQIVNNTARLATLTMRLHDGTTRPRYSVKVATPNVVNAVWTDGTAKLTPPSGTAPAPFAFTSATAANLDRTNAAPISFPNLTPGPGYTIDITLTRKDPTSATGATVNVATGTKTFTLTPGGNALSVTLTLATGGNVVVDVPPPVLVTGTYGFTAGPPGTTGTFTTHSGFSVATMAGSSAAGAPSNGAGVAFTLAKFTKIDGMDVGFDQTVYAADSANHCVYHFVNSGPNAITTFAGTPGTSGNTGDTGLATAATLKSPHGIAVDKSGLMLICDTGNNSLREIDNAGVITTFKGGLVAPSAVAIDQQSNAIFTQAGATNSVSLINAAAAVTLLTGPPTITGNIGPIALYRDAAAANNILWVADGPNIRVVRSLYAVPATTTPAGMTGIAPAGYTITGLAFDYTGLLYGTIAPTAAAANTNQSALVFRMPVSTVDGSPLYSPNNLEFIGGKAPGPTFNSAAVDVPSVAVGQADAQAFAGQSSNALVIDTNAGTDPTQVNVAAGILYFANSFSDLGGVNTWGEVTKLLPVTF